jgi:hypothetical protein
VGRARRLLTSQTDDGVNPRNWREPIFDKLLGELTWDGLEASFMAKTAKSF